MNTHVNVFNLPFLLVAFSSLPVLDVVLFLLRSIAASSTDIQLAVLQRAIVQMPEMEVVAVTGLLPTATAVEEILGRE